MEFKPQPPCKGVGGVAACLYDREYFLARLGAHIAGAVEHARYRRDGYTCFFRNIIYGHERLLSGSVENVAGYESATISSSLL